MYDYKIKQILRIIDGDTFDFRIDLGFNILHDIRVRLNGINTPESRTRDLKEKALGFKAKALSKKWLESAKELRLRTNKSGKFGRYLGEVINERGEVLNEILIENKLAIEYHGGKRLGWFEDVAIAKAKGDK